MLLKLTAQEEPMAIFVQTENITAFRGNTQGTEIATNNSELLIYVKETPEEIAEIWGIVVKGKDNGN